MDALLGLVLLEALGLVYWWKRTGRGIAPQRLWPNLAAGGCLMLALRFASGGATFAPIAVCLMGALLAHLLDLRARWNRR
jgi:hypothetical protein